jgi:hypothetical protein
MDVRPTAATTASRAWKRCRPLWFRIGTPARILWIVTSLLLAPFRRRYRYDPSRLRAFILVRDLHSPLQGLVAAFQQQGLPLERITLVDTGSSAPACLAALQRLRDQGCRYWPVPPAEQRFGPYVVWLSPHLRRELHQHPYPYLVTDADLQFPPNLPNNWLPKLFTTLNSHRFALKTSLPLRTGDLTVPQRAHIRAHERSLFRHPAYRLLSLLLVRRPAGQAVCTTDTTLSLYRPARCFSTLSVRLSPRYGLRHLPWYASFADSEEFRYYTTHKLSLFGEWSSLSADG